MALKDDFVRGRALRSITAAWLNGVARALNSLTVRFDKSAISPRVEKPPLPVGRSAWTIVLPKYPEPPEPCGPFWLPGPIEFVEQDGSVYLGQRWWKMAGTKLECPEDGIPVDNTYPVMANQTVFGKWASLIPLYSHASDHTDGVVTVRSEL